MFKLIRAIITLAMLAGLGFLLFRLLGANEDEMIPQAQQFVEDATENLDEVISGNNAAETEISVDADLDQPDTIQTETTSRAAPFNTSSGQPRTRTPGIKPILDTSQEAPEVSPGNTQLPEGSETPTATTSPQPVVPASPAVQQDFTTVPGASPSPGTGSNPETQPVGSSSSAASSSATQTDASINNSNNAPNASNQQGGVPARW